MKLIICNSLLKGLTNIFPNVGLPKDSRSSLNEINLSGLFISELKVS